MKGTSHEPVPADWTVEQGRNRYLEENGFTVEAYDDKWTKATAFGIDFAVPNTARHRVAIMLHDLHHVVTGFGTDFAGEGEVSAWEIRRGLRGLGVYVGSLVSAGLALGMVVSPGRTRRAWTASGAGHQSLFTTDIPYRKLLEMSVGELRERLRIPPDGLALERGLHESAPTPSAY